MLGLEQEASLLMPDQRKNNVPEVAFNMDFFVYVCIICAYFCVCAYLVYNIIMHSLFERHLYHIYVCMYVK